LSKHNYALDRAN